MAVKTQVDLRSATSADLMFINGIVEAAVMTWSLPERVKRLSMPSYRYDQATFEAVEMQLAVDGDGDIVGLAACCEPAESQALSDRKALLLHGIFVDATNHREGIGRELVQAVRERAKAGGYDGVLVNAQPDALAFFAALGFEQLPVVDEELDYKLRYWVDC